MNILSDALYLCDNGACRCGQHLGEQAKATGRDLSGQRIYQLEPADHEVGTPPFKCERCRATLGRAVKQGRTRAVLVRWNADKTSTVVAYAAR